MFSRNTSNTLRGLFFAAFVGVSAIAFASAPPQIQLVTPRHQNDATPIKLDAATPGLIRTGRVTIDIAALKRIARLAESGSVRGLVLQPFDDARIAVVVRQGRSEANGPVFIAGSVTDPGLPGDPNHLFRLTVDNSLVNGVVQAGPLIYVFAHDPKDGQVVRQIDRAKLASKSTAIGAKEKLVARPGPSDSNSQATTSAQPNKLALYYIHTDHLGTPRAITRPSDNKVVWKWDNTEPFGNSRPNENPSGLGNFEFNGRGAGQYYDKETDTIHNGYRTLAKEGRYIQSDPIGLKGGINTYAHVAGNPLKYLDPDGLVLIPVTLPGIGDTYLDDTFVPAVDQFIANAAARGVNVHVNSAYRTPQRQAALRNDPNAITPADNSLHSCGFAIDVNYRVLPAAHQLILRESAAAAGLSWGGNFRTPDPPHFFTEPPGDRDTLIRNATQEYLRRTAPTPPPQPPVPQPPAPPGR